MARERPKVELAEVPLNEKLGGVDIAPLDAAQIKRESPDHGQFGLMETEMGSRFAIGKKQLVLAFCRSYPSHDDRMKKN